MFNSNSVLSAFGSDFQVFLHPLLFLSVHKHHVNFSTVFAFECTENTPTHVTCNNPFL